MKKIYLCMAYFVLLCSCGRQEKGVPVFQVVEGWPEIPGFVTMDTTTGVAVDAQDNVYVLHRGTPPLLCYSREGKLIRSFGEGHFTRAHGIKIAPDGTIWTTDIEDHVVMQFSPDGKLLKTLGTHKIAGATDDTFNKPTDVAFTPSGEFFVTDGYVNTRVVKFSSDGIFQFAWGDSGSREGQFIEPHGAALDTSGWLYVCDRRNFRIQMFNQSGEFIAMWTGIGQPSGVAISRNNEIFITDWETPRVMMLNINGTIRTFWGTEGTGPGQFIQAHGIAVDSQGDVYVTEIRNKRVQKFVRKR